MTVEDRFRGAMGLAMKAGKCSAGDFVCEKLVKSGTAKLVLLDDTASDATKARYRGMCERAGIPLVEVEGLGEPIGKPGRMIAAVTDDNFVKLISGAYAKLQSARQTQIKPHSDEDTGVE